MSKHRRLLCFSILLCWMLLTPGLGIVGQRQVAHAAPLPDGYALSVTESTSTMTYGGTPPSFQAHLTVPDGENPLSSPNRVSFTIDSQRDYDPDGSGSSGSTYTFNLSGSSIAARFMALSGGQHTMVANYLSSVLGETLQSAPVTFTVQSLTPAISCSIDANLTAANATILFTMFAENGLDIDWADATYSITFIGAQTFTESNLTYTNGIWRASAPPVPGSYRYQCTFNGTNNFVSAQTAVSNDTLTVSQGHQATFKLYSNPTSITAGKPSILYIVLSGGPGLPTPTGQIAFSLPGGVYRTNLITLGSDGSVSVQITFPSGPPSVTTFYVTYSGDATYAGTTAAFPFTNPPIPGGSNPNPTPAPISTGTPSTLTPTPSGGNTPVPSSTATSSSTPVSSSTTTANGGQTFDNPPTISTPNQGGTLVYWMVALGLLALAGGSGIFIVLRNRARAAPRRAMATIPPGEDD